MKCVPSGRNWTHIWLTCPGESEDTGATFAPSEVTREIGLFTALAKRIVPSLPQAPCAISGTEQITSGTPPVRPIFFSLPAAQKPTNCESRDQKGRRAPSVWSIPRASAEPKGRIHKEL